jgi:alkylation response protein AidB-like acyl-CoA dehydrogenase
VAQSTLYAVRDLAPLIAKYADEAERERRLARPVVDALVDAGVFRLLVPPALGGAGASPMEFCEIIEAVSTVDGSTGWCVMIGGGYGHFSGLLPPPAAAEIFGEPGAVVAGTFRPNGVARPVAGGYQVNGQWPLASGSSHATWLVGGCRIFDGDQPQLTPTGRPLTRLMFLPVSAATILDTWHTAGLRGTASNDFLVRDLVVPAHRTCWFTHAAVRLEPQYRLPAIAFFAACIASVPLGIARHAIALFSALAGTKTPTWSQAPLREKVAAQLAVGQAEGLVRSGRAFLTETLRDAWATVTSGTALSWEQRGLLWLASTQVAAQTVQAVELLFAAAGASAIYASFGLERCLRDVRTAAQHICVTPTNFEIAGQLTLGLDIGGSVWSIDNRGDAQYITDRT